MSAPAEIERVPPSDTEAEMMLLGALLLEPDRGGELIDAVTRAGLQAADFYRRAHILVFAALLRLRDAGLPFDTILLRGELARSGALDDAGGAAYLCEIARSVYTPALAVDHARLVVEKARKRRMLDAARLAAEGLWDGQDVDTVRVRLMEALERDGKTASSYSDLFVSVAELIDPNAPTVVPFVPDFSWPGKITLTIGREKAGKSTFLYAKIGAMERGGVFLGRACRQTRAVILSEEPRAIIDERCRRFGVREAVVLPRDRVHKIPTWGEKVRAAVEAAEKHGCRYVLVDPVSKLAGLGPKDENDSGTVSALYAVVEAEMGDLSFELNHHAARDGGRSGIDSSRGTTAWTQNPDTIVTLSKPKARSNVRRIEWDGREMQYPDPAAVELLRDHATGLDAYRLVSRPDDSASEDLRRVSTLHDSVVAEIEAEWSELPGPEAEKVWIPTGRIVHRVGTAAGPIRGALPVLGPARPTPPEAGRRGVRLRPRHSARGARTCPDLSRTCRGRPVGPVGPVGALSFACRGLQPDTCRVCRGGP